MAVPYIFTGRSGYIPLSELDSDFATPITIGTTPVALGQTITNIAGLTGLALTGEGSLLGSYGAGAVSTNLAIGDGALVSNVAGVDNTAVGYNTLNQNIYGDGNTACGAYTLNNNTTGISNTAVGYSALNSTTTSINNTAVGSGALTRNTTGDNNSAFGFDALLANTVGYNNSAVGYSVLNSNTTGSQNTANGYSALNRNTTGTSNVAAGDSSLNSNTTGSQNTANGRSTLNDLKTTTILATAIVNGTSYQIITMGTTSKAKWIASGAVTGTVGETFTANAVAGVGTGTVSTSVNVTTQCLNNTALGYNTGRGVVTGSGNTIVGANVTGLSAALTNNIILANGLGSIRVQSDAATITFADVIKPLQATTALAPAYIKGGMYFDTTLNKMRIGGATAWETITSV